MRDDPYQKGDYFPKRKLPNSNFQCFKKFSVVNHSYLVRRLKDTYLYNDRGIDIINGVMMAGVERAVADLLYFNPEFYFDNEKKIDWKKVKQIQKEVGYL